MKKFTWDKWDYDCDGDAYVIAKDSCPNKKDVPMFIVKNDGLCEDVLRECDDGYGSLNEGIVEEGWCKYQVRSDWENMDGPHGSYYAVKTSNRPINPKTKKNLSGWFPVWIVRIGKWY